MKDLFRKTYFNHRNYLLEEFEHLNLTKDEFFLVMFIDYFNEFNIHIDIDSLSKKTGLSCEVVDELLNSLISKGYLEIQISTQNVAYSLQGIFQMQSNLEPLDMNEYQSLFEFYETAFARPLSQNEYMQLKDWMSEFDLKLIEYALKEAIVYDKKSFKYIYAILLSWKEKGFTPEAYEKGERL